MVPLLLKGEYVQHGKTPVQWIVWRTCCTCCTCCTWVETMTDLLELASADVERDVLDRKSPDHMQTGGSDRPASLGADDFPPWNRGTGALFARKLHRRSGPPRAVAVVPGPTIRPRRSSYYSGRCCCADCLSPPPQHRSQAQLHANHAKHSVEIRNLRRPNQVVFGE